MFTKINTRLKTAAAAGLMAAVGFTLTAGDVLADGNHRHGKRDGHGYSKEYSRSHAPAAHKPSRAVDYRQDRREDIADKRLGAAVANLLTAVITGEAPQAGKYTHVHYDRAHYGRGVWKVVPVHDGKRGWRKGRKAGHTIGRGHHRRGVFTVQKRTWDRRGNRVLVRADAYKDRYGNLRIVPGSRYIVRYL